MQSLNVNYEQLVNNFGPDCAISMDQCRNILKGAKKLTPAQLNGRQSPSYKKLPELSPVSYPVEKVTSIVRNSSPKPSFHMRCGSITPISETPAPHDYGRMQYNAIDPEKHLVRLTNSPRRMCFDNRFDAILGPGSYDAYYKTTKVAGKTIGPKLPVRQLPACGADQFYDIDRFDKLQNSRKIYSLRHGLRDKDVSIFK